MKGSLIEKFRSWKKKKRAALLGWEGMRTRAEHMNQESDGSLEVVQTGYTYIFRISNFVRREDMQEEEDRIKKGLAAGLLILDGRVSLVDVKPHLEVMERGKRNGD